MSRPPPSNHPHQHEYSKYREYINDQDAKLQAEFDSRHARRMSHVVQRDSDIRRYTEHWTAKNANYFKGYSRNVEGSDKLGKNKQVSLEVISCDGSKEKNAFQVVPTEPNIVRRKSVGEQIWCQEDKKRSMPEMDPLLDEKIELKSDLYELERMKKEKVMEKQKELQELERLKKEEMDKIEQQQELERLKKEEMDKIQQQELERLKKEEINRIQQKELERLKKEEMDKIQQELERLKKEEMDKIQQELERLKKEEMDKIQQQQQELERLKKEEMDKIEQKDVYHPETGQTQEKEINVEGTNDVSEMRGRDQEDFDAACKQELQDKSFQAPIESQEQSTNENRVFDNPPDNRLASEGPINDLQESSTSMSASSTDYISTNAVLYSEQNLSLLVPLTKDRARIPKRTRPEGSIRNRPLLPDFKSNVKDDDKSTLNLSGMQSSEEDVHIVSKANESNEEALSKSAKKQLFSPKSKTGPEGIHNLAKLLNSASPGGVKLKSIKPRDTQMYLHPFIIQISGKKSLVVMLTAPNSKSISPKCVYILSKGNNQLWIWMGAKSHKLQISKAVDLAQRVNTFWYLGKLNVVKCQPPGEPSEFWDDLEVMERMANENGEAQKSQQASVDKREHEHKKTGDIKTMNELPPQLKSPFSMKKQRGSLFSSRSPSNLEKCAPLIWDTYCITLCKIVCANGATTYNPVVNEQKKLVRSLLSSSFCFVLECVTELYVWYGKKTDSETRKLVLISAKKSIESGSCTIGSKTIERPVWCNRVFEETDSKESPLFVEKFRNWTET